LSLFPGYFLVNLYSWIVDRDRRNFGRGLPGNFCNNGLSDCQMEMKTEKIKRVFFAVLNMGLGHASRSLPIIREFLNKGWEIIVGSSGRSLLFLRKELNHVQFIELPDYKLTYSEHGVSLVKIVKQLPHVFKMIQKENKLTEDIIRKYRIDMVFSDHRYGCYNHKVPSYFISHQLRFIFPTFLRSIEFMGFWFNRIFHKKYRGVIVPDDLNGKNGLLSGRLSSHQNKSRYHFIGILSSLTTENDFAEDIDICVSISGPEPQRSVMENLVLNQINLFPGKKVVVLGRPELDDVKHLSSDITIYPHLNRQEMANLFNRSKLIISRSGYSTVMELAELGKKALFIPTPGQTEQIYLAQRFKNLGWHYSVEQKNLNLKNDVPKAYQYPGFPFRSSTQESIKRLLHIISNSFNDKN